MNNFAKILLFSLIVIFFFNSVFGQQGNLKVFSPDNTVISRNIIQKRDITRYVDGGAFRCSFGNPEGICDYEKIRKVIWDCWSEKTLCYVSISSSGLDSGRTEHFFIEPDKNTWVVMRRAENHHTIRRLRKPIHNLPAAYSVAWHEDKNERVLLFKNKFGKVIDEF